MLWQSNRGFQMLQRLGWQAGAGLGSRQQGRVEPVPIVEKRDVLGLGRDTVEVRPRLGGAVCVFWFVFYYVSSLAGGN